MVGKHAEEEEEFPEENLEEVEGGWVLSFVVEFASQLIDGVQDGNELVDDPQEFVQS